MGGGSWTESSFKIYSTSRGRSVSLDGSISGSYSNQDMFKSIELDEDLNPYKVIRECCNSDEHPNTIPVILGLDVTGSMGQTAVEVAKKLNVIMTSLYKEIKDVEFMVMGIGDLAYDTYPIQASQFESDIRIAEQLDKIYFEFGGGGNNFESYTAAWYFGLNNTKLDCWNQGRRGLIITMGDELLNPYLPKNPLELKLGVDDLQDNIETVNLYNDVIKKYEIYHINVEHRSWSRNTDIEESFAKVIGKQNIVSTNLNNVADVIKKIIVDFAKNDLAYSAHIDLDTTSDNTASNGVIITEDGIAW